MLKLSCPNISEEAIAAVVHVLRSGQLVQGSECEAFEQELAEYLNCDEVVLVSSGTAALHLALIALEIGQGDAVIIPDFTFPATANVVALTGARPVVVDVDLESYTMMNSDLKKVVENWDGPEQIKAIIPVHEFGCPADIEFITSIADKNNIFVIEDAACAIGASYKNKKLGTWGDIGCFSFHPRKILTTGEGGAIATDNKELAIRLRRLRNHGINKTESGIFFVEPSTNYRMTDFQAALGRCQLSDLDGWIRLRSGVAKAYFELLAPLESCGYLRLPKWKCGHSWQTFMVVLNQSLDRKQIIRCLFEAGVEANLGAQSMTSIGIYGDQRQVSNGPELYSQGLALPLFERMSMSDVRIVFSALCSCLGLDKDWSYVRHAR